MKQIKFEPVDAVALQQLHELLEHGTLARIRNPLRPLEHTSGVRSNGNPERLGLAKASVYSIETALGQLFTDFSKSARERYRSPA